MLKGIKSIVIIKAIFHFLNVERKCKLIVYNKRYQNILCINISDYMKFSGKYIIGDRNGIGKEYDGFNDTLNFEGEYKNGKRNGKGKEYKENGKMIFEGEYLNDKRNGTGQEY